MITGKTIEMPLCDGSRVRKSLYRMHMGKALEGLKYLEGLCQWGAGS